MEKTPLKELLIENIILKEENEVFKNKTLINNKGLQNENDNSKPSVDVSSVCVASKEKWEAHEKENIRNQIDHNQNNGVDNVINITSFGENKNPIIRVQGISSSDDSFNTENSFYSYEESNSNPLEISDICNDFINMLSISDGTPRIPLEKKNSGGVPENNINILDTTLVFEDPSTPLIKKKFTCASNTGDLPPEENMAYQEGDESEQEDSLKPRNSLLLRFDPIYSSRSPNTTITEEDCNSSFDLLDVLNFGNQLGNVDINLHLQESAALFNVLASDAFTNNTEKLLDIGDVELTQISPELKEQAFIPKECSDSNPICSSSETAKVNAVCEFEDRLNETQTTTSDTIVKQNSRHPKNCDSKVIGQVIPIEDIKISADTASQEDTVSEKETFSINKETNKTNSVSSTSPKNVANIAKDKILEKVDQVQIDTEADSQISNNKGVETQHKSITGKTMADVSDKLVVQEEESADLKLQLNASQQVRASLELQLRQKEEVIIKSQAESLRKDQAYKQEVKQLKEKLEEKCLENDNTQTKELQETLKSLKSREAKLISELNARKNDEQNYRKIMDEYEKTIGTQLAELQKLNEEHETVKRHLANLELAFSDVHQKYERSKKIIDGYKCNEDALRQTLLTSEDSVIKSEEKYESLKAHAKAQIEKSNQEMQLMREQYESEIHKLSAIIRRLEIKNSSLADSLDQKKKECSALAALCDEVTGKV